MALENSTMPKKGNSEKRPFTDGDFAFCEETKNLEHTCNLETRCSIENQENKLMYKAAQLKLTSIHCLAESQKLNSCNILSILPKIFNRSSTPIL
jgi:hypothetical protein